MTMKHEDVDYHQDELLRKETNMKTLHTIIILPIHF